MDGDSRQPEEQKSRAPYDDKKRGGPSKPEPGFGKPAKSIERKHYEQCLICCEDIKYYAIGDCGHNLCCWNCILRLRLKQKNLSCPYCKEDMNKVLFTSEKDDSVRNIGIHGAICDTEYDIYYQDTHVKNYI